MYFSGPPKLEYDARLKSAQLVRAGTSLIIQVDFTGVPTPTASWTLNGTSVATSQRATIDTTEYYTTLTVRNFTADDVGTYKVDVKNKAGSATASFQANIKGRFLLTQYFGSTGQVFHVPTEFCK